MSEQKKYKFSGTRKIVGVHAMNQIEALIDIPSMNIKVGDFGGWISCEQNLSHEGTCWISNGAVVLEDAVVSENALVEKNAVVSGKAVVLGTSVITGETKIFGNARIENSKVKAKALIQDSAKIINSTVGGNTKVSEQACISDSRVITDNGIICGSVSISNSKVAGEDLEILDAVNIMDSTIGFTKYSNKKLLLYGNATIQKSTINSTRDIVIGEDASILDNADVSGHEISIKGMAVVKGYVHIGLNTHLSDLVVIDGGKEKPKSPRNHYSLFSETIGGDAYVPLFKWKTS